MLKELNLKFGSAAGEQPLHFEPGPMTVFVGPNNSGKSLALREIESFCISGSSQTRYILEEFSLSALNREEIKQLLKARQIKPPEDQVLREGTIQVGTLSPLSAERRRNITLEQVVENVVRQGMTNTPTTPGLDYFCTQILDLYTIRLDGKTRLTLTEPQESSDLQGSPTNYLVALFTNRAAREEIRQLTLDAFDLHFVIDPTGMQTLRIRMSPSTPPSEEIEQGLHEEARRFHALAKGIEEFSDGVRAFTGLVSVVLSSDYRVMLIDEPEAFLHPPLAKKLGAAITDLAARRDARVFSATHSPSFLMGCVQSGREVNIIRLTYEHEQGTARLLPPEELRVLLQDPLLRTTDVLEALFHVGAVVCEADSDRAFYDEINARLTARERTEGARDTVFLNAQNKQTVGRIASPLRAMGIPMAMVVDLDILKKGDEFATLLKAGYLPEELRRGMGQTRGDIWRKFEEGGSAADEKGVGSLGASTRASLEALLRQLQEYGIFIVPVGALENWLSSLNIDARKDHWLIEAFKKLGSDPDAEGYVLPGEDDVWEFMRAVGAWIHDPTRKGIPAGSS